MILRSISIEGFLSYKTKQTIDFTNISTALVVGQFNGDFLNSNGSGKSSAFEAVAVCSWGKLVSRSETLDELINDECDTAHLSFEFEFERNIYKKERMWGKKSHNELYMYSADKWIPIGGDNADKRLIELLGVTPSTYSSILYLPQEGELKFIEGKASERKAILRELLNLIIFGNAEEKAKTAMTGLQGDLSIKAVRLEGLVNSIADESDVEQNMKSCKDDLKELADQIVETKKNITTYTNQVNALQKQLDAQKETVKEKQDLEQELLDLALNCEVKTKSVISYKEDLVQLKLDINEKNSLIKESKKILKFKKAELKELKPSIEKEPAPTSDYDLKLRELALGVREYEKDHISNKTKIGLLEEDIQRVSDLENVCPVTGLTCDAITGEGTYLVSKTTEVQSLQKSQKRLIAAIKKLTLQETELLETKKVICEANELIEQSKANYSKKTLVADGITEAIKMHTEVLNSYDQRIDHFNKAIEQCEKDIVLFNKQELVLKKKITNIVIPDMQKMQQEVDQLSSKQTAFIESLLIQEQNMTNKTLALGGFQKTLKDIQGMKAEKKELSTEIKKLKKELSGNKKLVKAFSKNGIQKTLMKQAVPRLEAISNRLLKKFCPTEDIRIRFDLDPTTKDGKESSRGGLDILIIKNQKSKKLNMYSGGEKVRYVFAIVLALAELLSQRAGKKMQTLIIDERISNLDESGIRQFAEVINAIKDRYKKLIVITHIQQLKEMFDQLIIVNKTRELGSVIING